MFLFRFACLDLTRKLDRALIVAGTKGCVMLGKLAPAQIAGLAAGLFAAMFTAAGASAEPAPPGCRWQSAPGGQILACKDAQGYWRRSGDNEIVGYDPPRVKPPPAPRPQPAAAAPVAPPEVAPPPRLDPPPAPPPPDMAEAVSPTGAVAAAAPPEPPIEPKPPASPVERFLRWLMDLWWGFWTWLGSLFQGAEF